MANHVFFDLHCHPGLKTFLTGNDESSRLSCWETFDLRGLLGFADKHCLGDMLDSNSSLTQLRNGHVRIAVVGLYAYERSMITAKITVLNIHLFSLRTLARIANRLGNRQIDHTVLNRISTDPSNYFDVFREVERHLLSAQGDPPPPRYILVNSPADIVDNELNIVRSIEGGHNLFGAVSPGSNVEAMVLNNLDSLKSSDPRYFFFAPAHLESNRLCTHAYGMKIITDERFLPDGSEYGISDLGRKVIEKALEKNEERQKKRILIDIKHMSLRSRLMYYAMLQEEAYRDQHIPIIASHMGVTGVSYRNMPVVKYRFEGDCYKVRYCKPAGLMGTTFNPWSINLYDEEIITIIESKGLIGMNFDERILGTRQRTRNDLTEYIGRREFTDYWDHDPPEPSRCRCYNGRTERYPKACLRYQTDVKHLCNNILHIVRIGGEEAWNHICIGSDFDGLVNFIDPYNSAEELGRLRRHMIKWLLRMAESTGSNTYGIDITNVERRVDAIMYENAHSFLITHL